MIMRIIDAQIHLWAGGTAPAHHWRSPFTVERALADMQAAGVSRAVNCPPLWDPAADEYADRAVLDHPDRFATMGGFPLDDTADASSVDRALSRPGLLGLRFILPTPELGDRLASGALDWLFSAAHERQIPVALIVLPRYLPAVADIAGRYPRMRLVMDHLALSPFEKLPEAAAHFDDLLALARRPNIAVKATGVPGTATDPYPYPGTHELIRRAFNAFGAERVFWGTDITRLPCTWPEAVTMFTDELSWLKGRDLELVMGDALAAWIGWHR
jgi:predicted TIM-barrel fold metal-dependent hydrolase